jgi:hypothetical protein
MLDIEIHKAKSTDSERLKQVAIKSKSYWGYSDNLILQWAQTPIITPESIEKDIVYAAYVNSCIIGWYRLVICLPVVISSLDKPETGGVTAHIWDQHGTYAPYMGHLS